MQIPNTYYSPEFLLYPSISNLFFNPYYIQMPYFMNSTILQQNVNVDDIKQKISQLPQKKQPKPIASQETVKQSHKIQKKTLQDQQSDYQPQKMEILNFYKKKNTESNIINQVFSFISTQKSQRVLMKILQKQKEKVQKFYNVMKRIKKYNKRYMNRNFLLDLIKFEENGPNYKVLMRSKGNYDLSQLRRTIRIIIFYFFTQQCTVSLLTSKKMNKQTLRQHFLRKKEVIDFLEKEIQKQ